MTKTEIILREEKLLRLAAPGIAKDIRQAVNSLPVELHKTAILIYSNRLSAEQAAPMLHCTPRQVRRRKKAIEDRLADSLNVYWRDLERVFNA
ncbi:hypothetical protein FACS1894216_16200 [Synergistales bacterium]|nr:hypothetical protein FACS1894216_16200 [Synergistales bacterium]